MESTTSLLQLSDLSRRFILLERDYQPENISFSLWGRRAVDGHELMAVTLSGDGRDLMEGLAASLISSAEAHVDRIYLHGQEECRSAARSAAYARPHTAAWPALAA